MWSRGHACCLLYICSGVFHRPQYAYHTSKYLECVYQPSAAKLVDAPVDCRSGDAFTFPQLAAIFAWIDTNQRRDVSHLFLSLSLSLTFLVGVNLLPVWFDLVRGDWSTPTAYSPLARTRQFLIRRKMMGGVMWSNRSLLMSEFGLPRTRLIPLWIWNWQYAILSQVIRSLPQKYLADY